jgi:acyl-CoA thioester hydrolase
VGRPFRHRVRVRYSDCDPQGVLFFANHLTYFDVAVTELWREAIGPYGEMVDGGIDMVVAEASVRYRAPVVFDAEVEVSVEVVRLGRTAMTSRLAIREAERTLSEGELRHVFVSAGGTEKAEIPDRIRAGLKPYLASAGEVTRSEDQPDQEDDQDDHDQAREDDRRPER